MYSLMNVCYKNCRAISDAPTQASCKITLLFLATVLTLSIGGGSFCGIFFTTHLVIPAIAASASIVVILGGTDVILQICCCCKKKKIRREESANEIHINRTIPAIKDDEVKPESEPTITIKQRIATAVQKNDLAYSEEQIQWLETHFKKFESSDNLSLLQKYLYAAANYDTTDLQQQSVDDFLFSFQSSCVFVTVPTATIEAKNIEPEDFAEIIISFLEDSKDRFNLFKQGQSVGVNIYCVENVSRPLKSLNIMYRYVDGYNKFQLIFEISDTVCTIKTRAV